LSGGELGPTPPLCQPASVNIVKCAKAKVDKPSTAPVKHTLKTMAHDNHRAKRKPGGKKHGGFKKPGRGNPRHHGGKHPRRDRHGSAGHEAVARGFWLFGGHGSSEALLNPKRRVHRVVVTQAGLETIAPILEQATKAGLSRPQAEVLDNTSFAETITDAPNNGGIAIDVAPLQQPDLPSLIDDLPANAPCMLLVLDQVTDPHNIGAIIRSAAAFGALAVIAQDRNAPEETAIMTKIASGGMEHVPYVKVTNIARSLQWLQEQDVTTYGLDERGDMSLDGAEFSPRSAIVLGAEGSGLRRLVGESCQHMISLPTKPPILSLNVSNAAAVTLFAWSAGQNS